MTFTLEVVPKVYIELVDSGSRLIPVPLVLALDDDVRNRPELETCGMNLPVPGRILVIAFRDPGLCV